MGWGKLTAMRFTLLPLLLHAACTTPEQVDVEVPPDGARIEVLNAATCADPGARETEGPFAPWSLGAAWESQPQADNTEWQYTGGGAAVADFNGDGTPDLYLPSAGDSLLLLSDGAGAWIDGSAGLPPSEGEDLGIGGVAADADGDGDLDLYTLVLHGQNRLLDNDGSGGFTDITADAGLASGDDDTTHATFADVDGDGDLDLVTANHNEGPHLGQDIVTGDFEPAHDNRLFLSDGHGGFVDHTADLPAAFRSGYGFVAVVEDFDQDGQDELLSVNDFGPFHEPNSVARRQDEAWTVDTELRGLDIAAYGMGAAVGDINGDGLPDLLITSWGELVLLESTGDGGWVRSGASRSLWMGEGQSMAWGANFADMDNDGDLDAAVAMGPLVMPDDIAEELLEVLGLPTEHDQPDALFIQGEDGLFVDRAAAWGVADTGVGRGVLPVDLDGDGWLDLLHCDLDGDAVIHRARCGEASALQVELRQAGPNPFAVGARLTAETASGTQHARIRAGGTGHAMGGPPEAHFGLGDADTVGLRIVWPDGEVDTFKGVSAGRVRIWRDAAAAD
jgi:enediyne biosynthesis protein E4